METEKNRSIGAGQSVGPAESCMKIGDFVRIMADNLKRENIYPVCFAKEFRWRFLWAAVQPDQRFGWEVTGQAGSGSDGRGFISSMAKG